MIKDDIEVPKRQSQVHIEPQFDRLHLLYETMLEVDKHEASRVEFDMSCWTRASGPSQHRCGAAACAVGYATMIPAFNKLGLYFDWRVHEPGFDGELSWVAVYNFFGVTQEEAAFLFSPYEYPLWWDIQPLLVARRIKRLVEHLTTKGAA